MQPPPPASPQPPAPLTIERLQPFATPIFRLRLPGFEAWNGALKAGILARRAADAGVLRSNRSGWHSADDAHLWDDAAMRELCVATGRALVGALGNHYPAAGKLEAQLAMCWANVNTEGGWNVPHQHSSFPWVGSYYVDLGRPRSTWAASASSIRSPGLIPSGSRSSSRWSRRPANC